MSDLVSRLLAAIEETERLAREALGKIASPGERWRSNGLGHVAFYDDGDETFWYSVEQSERGDFIAHNDPAAVLRRCVSDRRVLERHNKPEPMDPMQVRVWGFDVKCGHCSWTCYTDGEDMVKFPCPELVDLAGRYGISVEEETTQ